MLVVDDLGRQSRRLLPEEEDVAIAVVHLGEGIGRVRRERDDPTIPEDPPQVVEVRVDGDVGEIVVVESGSAKLRIRQVEAERFDEVEVAR